MSEQYRRLVELSPDAIFISRDFRITFLNPAAVRLCGASAADELQGQSLLDLVHPDSRTRVGESVGRWMAGQSAPPIEARISRPDASTVDIEMAGARLDDGVGHDVQLVVRDITERRRSEAALRENEERLTLAFAGAQEGVWDWNLETNAVFYSPRWKQMLGYAEHEIEAHVSAWERVLHPDDKALALQLNEGVRRGERSYEGEFRLRHKDGHYLHVLSRGFPVRRERRAGRPHRRHAPRHHRAQADRSGAARERRAADAGVRRRAGRRLGLEPRHRRGRVFFPLERDARLRRR